MTAHVTRNPVGQITSGTVVFDVLHQFAGATQISGLHVHRAQAGVAGPIVIESGLAAVTSPTGVGSLYRIVNVDAGAPEALAALGRLIAAPHEFYVNVHTQSNPSGALPRPNGWHTLQS